MSRPSSAAPDDLAAPHILIVSAARQAHHPFLRDLIAAPSVLGSHYVVVTMTADEATVDADEPFTLIIIDYAYGSAPVVDALRAAAPHTALLLVERPDGPPVANASHSYELTTAAQLRAAVARVLRDVQGG
jgi:hypothetical protein